MPSPKLPPLTDHGVIGPLQTLLQVFQQLGQAPGGLWDEAHLLAWARASWVVLEGGDAEAVVVTLTLTSRLAMAACRAMNPASRPISFTSPMPATCAARAVVHAQL